jgi:acyl carrier protein
MPSLAKLRSVLARLGPASLVRASWRRPEEPVEPRVRCLVAERLGVDPEELTPDVSLTDDLAVDSLDLVDLAIGLEDRFGITVPESTIDELRTYGELVDVTEARVQERRAKEASEESQRTPPMVWARVLPPPSSQPSGSVECAGWLTPYTAETIVESALHAGAGARLDVRVPPNLGEPALAEIKAEFAWLRGRDIGVHVRRDPDLPRLGTAA